MSVGDRMAEILKPADGREPEVRAAVERDPEVRAILAARVASDRPTGFDIPVAVEPELPPEVADPIRAALRAGNYEAAAELATKVLDSLGIEPAGVDRASPEGVETPAGSGDTTV